jgi:hypothetical protein
MDMKIRIKRFFSRIKLRLYLWTKGSSKIVPTFQEESLSYEKTCFKICLKVIQHRDTEFMIAPVSEKRYLKNEDMKIFITLTDRRVEITNHVYNYNVKLNLRDWQRLTYIFDGEADKRRLNYENEVNSQITNSLHNILDQISNF